MPGDKDHAIAYKLAGKRHRLIGVAEVVADDQLDILAEDAGPGVEIRDRHPGAALVLLAGQE
jgi:oligoribonuclease (3'-5' exoribonuclease)